MPSAQVIDLNPLPRTEATNLEKTLSGFANRHRENQIERQDTDALKDIYSQYQQDGQNLERTIQEIQTRPGISPTTRVNTVKQLMDMHDYNSDLQKKAQVEVDKAKEESQKAENNKRIVSDLETRRGLDTGALSAYESDPKMAEQVSRPPKETKVNQADRPPDAAQLKNIEKVMNSPEWKKANSLSQKQQLLARGGVSTPNQKSILDPLSEEQKIDVDKQKYEKDFEYTVHKDSAKFDEEIHKEAKAARNQLDAIKGVEESIKNVKPYTLANIFRNFGEIGKSISNAILSKDEARIQASIPAFLEGRKELFGIRLSDADLALLSDKLPDIGKSESANREILKMMKKYSKLSLLKEKISNNIKNENKGFRPIDYTQQVEDTFDEMKKPVSVISPVTGRKIEIPAYELREALESGATLVNE